MPTLCSSAGVWKFWNSIRWIFLNLHNNQQLNGLVVTIWMPSNGIFCIPKWQPIIQLYTFKSTSRKTTWWTWQWTVSFSKKWRNETKNEPNPKRKPGKKFRKHFISNFFGFSISEFQFTVNQISRLNFNFVWMVREHVWVRVKRSRRNCIWKQSVASAAKIAMIEYGRVAYV